MGLDRKLIQEITRYHNINNYIMEQDAIEPEVPIEDELGPLSPPTAGGDVPPPPAPSEAIPPAAPVSTAIDVANDPDIEKIDDEGNSEEITSEGDDSEELDITDLVTSQKNIETKQEEYFENLFNQLSNLESKLGEMDNVMNKLNSLEMKIEKYREKTPQEKLELRSYDSYPFNQKLSQFFDDKQDEMEKTGKNEYVLTSDEVEDINSSDVKNSFQPNSQVDEYKSSFKK
jgi:hypothetical protein